MVGRLVVGGILTAIAISELTTNGNNSVIRPCLFINRWRYRLRAVRNITRGQVFDENLMAIATVGAFAIQQYSEAVAVMLFYQENYSKALR